MNLHNYTWNRNQDTHQEYREEEIAHPGDHDIENVPAYKKGYKPITLHIKKK